MKPWAHGTHGPHAAYGALGPMGPIRPMRWDPWGPWGRQARKRAGGPVPVCGGHCRFTGIHFQEVPYIFLISSDTIM